MKIDVIVLLVCFVCAGDGYPAQLRGNKADQDLTGHRVGRIRRKTIFVPPSFDEVTNCPNGYVSDNEGNCLQIIEIDQNNYRVFLLTQKVFTIEYEDEDYDDSNDESLLQMSVSDEDQISENSLEDPTSLIESYERSNLQKRDSENMDNNFIDDTTTDNMSSSEKSTISPTETTSPPEQYMEEFPRTVRPEVDDETGVVTTVATRIPVKKSSRKKSSQIPKIGQQSHHLNEDIPVADFPESSSAEVSNQPATTEKLPRTLTSFLNKKPGTSLAKILYNFLKQDGSKKYRNKHTSDVPSVKFKQKQRE